MAQYFDYFVCTRDQMQDWLNALIAGTDHYALQLPMDGHVYFKSLSYEWVYLLAAGGEPVAGVDPLRHLGRIELLGVADEIEGPWVVQIAVDVVETLRRLPLSAETLDRWRLLVADYHGSAPAGGEALTYENAVAIQNLCVMAAARPDLGLFCCFWG